MYPFLGSLNPEDFIFVMTVYPGLGGQAFIEEMLLKIEKLNTYRCQNQLPFHIEVDGGITDRTGALCKSAGVDYLVAGSFITKANDKKKVVKALGSC